VSRTGTVAVHSQPKQRHLAGLLSKQGLAAPNWSGRSGNHLFVRSRLQSARRLDVDTGSPNTVIDVNSVNNIWSHCGKDRFERRGLFGRSGTLGTSTVKARNGQLHRDKVPVAIADFSGMNPEHRAAATGSHLADSKALAHINGVLGAREMVKFGMIIDCTRQMLYVNPNGRSSGVSQSLAIFWPAADLRESQYD